MADKSSDRRRKAAQAQAAALSQQQRRDRTTRIVGLVTVAVVAVVIVGLAVWASSAKDSTAGGSATAPDAAAAVPAGVIAAGEPQEFGVPVGSAPATAPLLEIWEDFQCPACGAVEEQNGAGIVALADAGKIRLVWRPTTFLDAKLRNDSSERAVAAWGCAIDQGKSREFHDLVFANQPTTEGTGYPQDLLVGFGEQLGLTGDALTTFTSCVNEGTYRTWAANSTQVFRDSGIQGTPTGVLNGEQIGGEVLADAAALEAAVAKATK